MADVDSGVVFLYGSDEFAIARRLAELQATLDKQGMNTARFDARTANEDELNTAVNAVPFLAERRLVVLANPSARYTTPEARKKFCEFLQKVPPTTLLVLTEPEALKDDHWLVKWARAAKDGVQAQVCNMPRVWEMPAWIQRETQKQGGQIEEQAAARLAEMVGEDTRQAVQEITKLLTYVNYTRSITAQDVERVSPMTAQGDIFALVDALGLGKGKDAQAMLHRLLEEQDPLYIFSMVVRQFRLLILAREVIDAGGSLQEAQQALGVHPFVVGKAFNQAKRFSMGGLEAIYRRLLAIDEAAKTGQMPLDLALDTLVMELMRK